jgi:hypothetical protein
MTILSYVGLKQKTIKVLDNLQQNSKYSFAKINCMYNMTNAQMKKFRKRSDTQCIMRQRDRRKSFANEATNKGREEVLLGWSQLWFSTCVVSYGSFLLKSRSLTRANKKVCREQSCPNVWPSGQGSMLWSHFYGIFENFRPKNWRFCKKNNVMINFLHN